MKRKKTGNTPVEKYTKPQDMNQHFKLSGTNMVMCSLTLKTH